MTDSSRGRSEAKFEIVSAHRSFTDPHHTVEVYAVGPNPHAEQMLVVYLPNERLLFEADMLDIDVPPGQTPIAGDDTDALRRRIRELGLNVATIVPAHGRVGTHADLETAARPRRRE